MHRDYHIGGKLLQLRDCVLDIIRWCDAQVEAAEHGVQLVGAMNTAMAEGMIIAQRRPRRSPIQPQKLVAKKTRRLKSKTGVATRAGLRFRSFCRCVANIAMSE